MHFQPCRDWWKMRCMFTRVVYQCKLKGCWSSVDICLYPELTSRSDQPIGASSYPYWSFYTKIFNPEWQRYFTLASLINRNHRVNLGSLLGPCFAVVVYNETWWPMYNVHLSYNPPSSWRILFWFRGYARQFSILKSSGSWQILAGYIVRRKFFKVGSPPQVYL